MPGSPLPIRRSWPGREATALAWSADGSLFASAIRSEITVSAGEPADSDLRVLMPGPVLSLAFGDDQLLAAPFRMALGDGAVLDDVTPALTADLPAAGYLLRACVWSPSADRAVLAGQYQPPRGIPAKPGWSGPSARVVSARGEQTSVLWEGTAVAGLTVAAGADWTAFADTTVRLVRTSADAATPDELATRDAVARALAFDAGEGRVAVGFADGWVSVFDTETGATAASWRAHDGDVHALVWVGGQLVTGGAEGSVRVFAVGGEALASSEPREYQPIVALAVHPDGDRMLASVGGPRAELLEFRLGGD